MHAYQLMTAPLVAVFVQTLWRFYARFAEWNLATKNENRLGADD